MEDRLTKIEIKLAHHELTIETLNQVITVQQNEISQLLDKIELLNSKINSLKEQDKELIEPPPPHY